MLTAPNALKKVTQPAQKPAVRPLAAPVQPMGTTSPQSQAPQPLPAPQAPQTPVPVPPAPVPSVGGIAPVSGAAVSAINPTNDLRSTTIAPQAGPNLTELAQQQYKDFLAGTADERKLGLRQIGQSAAKFGRLGSGMVTTDVGNLADLMNRRELEAARGLAADVATGHLTENRANRNELRGERDYQTGRADNAIDRQVQQRLLEEQMLNSEFSRNMGQAGLAYEANRDIGTQYAEDSSSTFDDLSRLLTERAMRPGQVPTMTPPTFPTSTPRVVTQAPPTPRLPRI